jgi:hypothetical protein
MQESNRFTKLALPVLAVLCLSICTQESAEAKTGNARLDLSIGLHSWPDVEDLQSFARGELDEMGFYVAFSAHWPFKQNNADDFLLGFDLGLFPDRSGIIPSGGYLVPSVKWHPGESRALSLGAGFGFYWADFEDIAGEAALFSDTDEWRKSGFGGYFGGSWIIGSGQESNRDGLLASFKIHFVDLGQVNGQELTPPLALGDKASKLDRGFYQLHLGYHWE